MSNIEMPNIYKKNYKIEKYRDFLCNKLVSLNGGDISYKLIFGPSPEMVYVREKEKVNHYDLMQRKMKFKNIVKLYEFSFNNKLKKLSNNYITNMFNLLSNKDKNYIEKRKNLIETNNNNRNNRIKLLKKTFLFPFSEINNNTINYNSKNSHSIILNESNLKINQINIKNSSNNDTIKVPRRNKKNIIKRKNISRDIENNFDDGSEKKKKKKSVFEKLKKENNFFEIYNKSDYKLKRIMDRIKKVPDNDYLNNNFFLQKEKTIERLKKSSSCNDCKTNNETNNYKTNKTKLLKTNKKLCFSNSSINIMSKYPHLKSKNKNIFIINCKEYNIDKIKN